MTLGVREYISNLRIRLCTYNLKKIKMIMPKETHFQTQTFHSDIFHKSDFYQILRLNVMTYSEMNVTGHQRTAPTSYYSQMSAIKRTMLFLPSMEFWVISLGTRLVHTRRGLLTFSASRARFSPAKCMQIQKWKLFTLP